MFTTPAFGPQLIGRTEKALSAILDRLLADTGLTEPQWVTLTLAVTGETELDRAHYARRVAEALKIEDSEAAARIRELAARRLLTVPTAEADRITVTHAGSELHRRVRAAVTELTGRLWGDLDAADLATAGQVLGTVLQRANQELVRVV